MKIRTKLVIEVIILVSLVGTVSFFAIMNTRQVQESYDKLSTDTVPAMDNLRDMRLAATLLTSSTMEILLAENEAKQAQGPELREIEEEIEFELMEIENAKALFSQAITKYSVYLQNNFPDGIDHRDKIAAEWYRLVDVSNNLLIQNYNGASPDQILKIKDEFEDAQHKLNKEIFSGLSFISAGTEEKHSVVTSTIDSTILSILITLNLFIVAALTIRYFVLKSLTQPLAKLRKTATEISEGNFVTSDVKGNDEMAELGHDIDKMSTELQKLNHEIVRTERLSSIGSLASRLAHDLRNPLSVIKNSMEILKMRLSPHMDEKIDHQLAMVGRAISRMSHQIEDVLDFVNVSDLKSEASSIITIIESALLSTDIPKSVKINMPKNSATVICDPYRMEVVFSNLIKNASQAVNGRGEITFRIIDKKDDVLIEIEDSGPGIPDEVLPKIFEPLFTTKQTGTGLGLASCRSIVEKHGGSISVHNNPTVFSILLPKKPVKKLRNKIIERLIVNE